MEMSSYTGGYIDLKLRKVICPKGIDELWDINGN